MRPDSVSLRVIGSYTAQNGAIFLLLLKTTAPNDPKSGTEYADFSVTQRANRLLLKTVMVKQGFKPYPKEWWHFTLKEEPYPDCSGNLAK